MINTRCDRCGHDNVSPGLCQQCWEPPRCGHGNVILGCPREDCEAQNRYLDQLRRAEASAAAAREAAAWAYLESLPR